MMPGCHTPTEMLQAYEAGAHALGFVAPLFDPGELAQGRFDLVEQRAQRLLATIG